MEAIRADFPILHQQVHGKPLVYLDSANTSQKPQAVIEAESRVYREIYANVHRGVYDLSVKAEKAFEGARHTVQRFLNAPEAREIVFLRGTTEAVNLVANTFGTPAGEAGRRDPDLGPRAPFQHRAPGSSCASRRAAC